MQLGVIAEGLGMKVIYFDVESKLPLGNAQPKATCPVFKKMLINASRGIVVDLDA